MDNNDSESMVFKYIDHTDNAEWKTFFLAVQQYHKRYELEELLPILPFITQLRTWLDYLNNPPDGLDLHWFIINEHLYGLTFNDFERYIILDVLSSFLNLLNFKTLSFLRKQSAIEQFSKTKGEISQKIIDYSPKEIKAFIDSFAGMPDAKQIELLSIYKRLYFRITKTNQGSNTNFIKIVNLQISILQQSSSSTPNDILSETIEKLTQEQQTPAFNDAVKLSVKDVAKVINCSESQTRRFILRKRNPIPMYRHSPRGKMYFVYSEIIDWFNSNKQQSSLEEAGEVFRRKPRGAGKKRRPPLG